MYPFFIILACVTQILPLQPSKVSHAMDSLHCLDWQNKPVADGEKYVPNKDDPCMMCTCSKGYRIMCTSVACSPPGNCALWKQIDGVCCEYQCIMSGEGNDVQGGNTNFNSTHPDHNGGTSTDDESITNLGLRLVASTVTSFLVLALLLFMVHRLRQRRLLMAMRRFEAQARLQQLEETDSDHYIPETFLGIECPPYEDPPPPYSPPKPHPRILPGEAPPPYEEIDQNPLSPLNNNEINRVITEENRAPTPRQCPVVPSATNNQRTETSNCCVQTSAVPNVECRIENEEMRRNNNPGEGGHHGGVCVLPDFNGLMHTYISGNLNMTEQSNRSRNSYLANNDCVSQTSPVRDAPLLSSSVHSELRNEADCSCDEEQTMLKRCYSPERENNLCLSPRQHSPLLQSSTSTSNRCENFPTATSDAAQTTMSASMTEASNSNRNANQYSRFASLPRQLRSCTTDYQRASTLFPTRATVETLQGIPLVDLRKTFSSEQTDAADASTSAEIGNTSQPEMRSAADGSSRQDLLRGTLKPLTLSDKVTPLCSNILVPNQGQASVQSSEARLRNLRLSNLMNSPTKQMDGSTSPVTPDGQPIKRSQSVTSEISIFSVCSETGEVRLPKPVGTFLRNDSQYPEVLMRTSQIGQPVCSVLKNPSSEANNAQIDETADNNVSENPRSVLQAITEDQVGHGNVGGAIGASALIKNFNKLNKELKEKSKKKDKCKANRHSTGSLPPQKPKKVRQSCVEAGPSSESKQRENSSKKYDASRRKAAKQSGLLKQYGFIDDNSACPPKTSGGKIDGANEPRMSESKELSRSKREGENCRNKVDMSRLCDSTVLQVTPEVAARNARQSSLRPGVKRQLNYSEKTHSPSPTRNKSRPKSMFPSCSNGTSSKDSEATTLNDLSKDSSATCIPKRKSKSSSSSRNKKRQSHPASNMQCAQNTGIVLSRPNILASVADMTNETVYPVAEPEPEPTNNRNTTLLNGYVYKYNTDTKSQDNGNVYVKLRPTSLSSYV